MDASKTNIILGPPGTGKTTSLLTIVEEALAAGVKPQKIGFISFTKKAAEEGRDRAIKRFNLPEEVFPHFRTLHSMAFRQLGLRKDQVFGWQHIRDLGKILGIDFKGRGEVADDDVYGMNSADRLLFLEGLARNTRRPLKEVWQDAFEDAIDWWELERFEKALQMFKKNNRLVDYTDMLERFCEIDQRFLPEFDLLIVDEAQDLSSLQWDMVDILSSKAKTVYVGGDDDQAIFSWSGANVQRFIGMSGKVRTLDVSYRIPNTVHQLAETISSRISSRRPKSWAPRDERGSVNWVSDFEEADLSKDSWLLLARNGYMLNDLEDWCLGQGFSFHSVNRDPLKSPALGAIRTWESLRRGNEESAERILEMLRYASPLMVPVSVFKKLKSDKPGILYDIKGLVANGLKATPIWHEFLTKISPKERDYFIAARRRGEPLLKEPRIQISTIHASKGGQADHVLLMTDMSYRCHSNMQNNSDDETRVWYVAATRCKQSLNFISPKTNLNFEV